MSGRTAERNRSTQMTGPWGRADTMPGVGSAFFEAVVEASGVTAGGKHSRNDRYLPTRTSATDRFRSSGSARTGRSNHLQQSGNRPAFTPSLARQSIHCPQL